MSNNPKIKKLKTKSMFRKIKNNSKAELPFGWILYGLFNSISYRPSLILINF